MNSFNNFLTIKKIRADELSDELKAQLKNYLE